MALSLKYDALQPLYSSRLSLEGLIGQVSNTT